MYSKTERGILVPFVYFQPCCAGDIGIFHLFSLPGGKCPQVENYGNNARRWLSLFRQWLEACPWISSDLWCPWLEGMYRSKSLFIVPLSTQIQDSCISVDIFRLAPSTEPSRSFETWGRPVTNLQKLIASVPQYIHPPLVASCRWWPAETFSVVLKGTCRSRTDASQIKTTMMVSGAKGKVNRPPCKAIGYPLDLRTLGVIGDCFEEGRCRKIVVFDPLIWEGILRTTLSLQTELSADWVERLNAVDIIMLRMESVLNGYTHSICCSN